MTVAIELYENNKAHLMQSILEAIERSAEILYCVQLWWCWYLGIQKDTHCHIAVQYGVMLQFYCVTKLDS